MFFNEILLKDDKNIIFLKKERTYTKLKYSRVTQADIVSGGVAALFSAFLGYLISEKFGFELIDSGDFYILLMYLVFLIGSMGFFFKFSNTSNVLIFIFLPIKQLYKIVQIFFLIFIKKLLLIVGK